MTDFVTRLEAELHSAALRSERRGRVRGAVIPRARLVLGDIPAVALATVLLALAIAAAAALVSLSPRQGSAADLPGELRGVWRAAPTELRLYAAGSQRCADLGLGSSTPCYALGLSSTRVATDWGKLSLARDTLTLRSYDGSPPGEYRWQFEGDQLRLTRVSDRNGARVRALVTMPLARAHHPNRHPGVPVGWAAQELTSARFGYSVRVPHFWSLDARGHADRLSGDATDHVLPEVLVTAQRLKPGTSAARWAVIVQSVPESSGCVDYDYRPFFVGATKVRVSVYPGCGAPHIELASFVHNGRGYRVTWRGKSSSRPENDYRRFDAMLETVRFSP
jgi:hypothetical protein